MQLFNLQGKRIKPLSELVQGKTLSRRAPSVRADQVPATRRASFTVFGRGIPPSQFPPKCLWCRRLVHAGEAWHADSNGEYWTLVHVECE